MLKCIDHYKERYRLQKTADLALQMKSLKNFEYFIDVEDHSFERTRNHLRLATKYMDEEPEIVRIIVTRINDYMQMTDSEFENLPID